MPHTCMCTMLIDHEDTIEMKQNSIYGVHNQITSETLAESDVEYEEIPDTTNKDQSVITTPNDACEATNKADAIKTTLNVVYGVSADGIQTTVNELYGVSSDGIETTPNIVYGVTSPEAP